MASPTLYSNTTEILVEEKTAGRKWLPYHYHSSLIHLRIIYAQIKMSRKKTYKKHFFQESGLIPKKWFFNKKERFSPALDNLQPKMTNELFPDVPKREKSLLH